MLTENELKCQIRPIVDNDYTIPDTKTAFELAYCAECDDAVLDEILAATKRAVATDELV